ncbi:MAG: hypothetical protein AAF710_03645 [Planctomycetota bacterium]
MQAAQQLDELIVHAKNLITEIEEGRYDDDGDLSYPIALSHLMDHLVRAWHYSQMTDDQVARISQEQFERVTYSIPKLNIEHRLVELYDPIV